MKHQCDVCKKDFQAEIKDKTPINCKISATLQAHFEKSFFTCVCSDCVEAFQKIDDLAQKTPFPPPANAYKEGLHYYIDGGLWVFTTFYHYQKGYCCKNACRHCAYGYTRS